MKLTPFTTSRLAAAAAIAICVAACGDDEGVAPPTTGTLEVTVVTTGDAPDPDGYTASVGSASQDVAINGTVTFSDVAEGDQTVELTELADNCSVEGDNPRTVAVTAGETAATTFDVTCSASALEVTVATTGDDPDPDGYTLTVEGDTRAVATAATEMFTDLVAGDYDVELGDLAVNCSVEGENPRTVTVPAGETAATTFDVICPPTELEVTVSTTGEAPDPDGYTVVVGSSEEPLEVNGTVTYAVDAGTHTVDLRDVAFNCVVAGDNPRNVDVAWGGTTTTTFDVDCPAPLAVLDGVRSPGEWDAATTVAAFDGATFYYMNDGVNLYLAFEVEDETLGSDDVVQIRFDNERDGVLNDGEDNLSLNGAGSFSDLHSSATSWNIFDGQQDGAGAAGATGGVNFFEMAHPLNSGDPDDFALSPGDTVGYCIIYRMNGVGVTATTFPIGCLGFGGDLSGFAELEVSAAASPVGRR